MLIKLHAEGQKEALFFEEPEDDLVAAALDLQSFGLLNQALGPRLCHVVLDLVSGALMTYLEAASKRRGSRLWMASLGDEFYLFSRSRAGAAKAEVSEVGLAVEYVSRALEGSFAPVRVMAHGSPPRYCLTSDQQERLCRLGIVSASVSHDAVFDALACIPAGHDIHAHARFCDRMGGSALSVVPHPLYFEGGKKSGWRLPFPAIRAAVGQVTGVDRSRSAGNTLDSIFQELARTTEMMRSANAAWMRRDMRVGMAAFDCAVMPNHAAGTAALSSVRQMEKEIARDAVPVGDWQLIMIKPTWSLSEGKGKPVGIGSLKGLLARSHPGFVERFLAYQHQALAVCFADAAGHFGVHGRSLLLVVRGPCLSRDDIIRRLDGFRRSFSVAGRMMVSRLDALSLTGKGKGGLILGIECARAGFPDLGRSHDCPGIQVVAFDETALAGMERTADAHRASALRRYERCRLSSFAALAVASG